MAWVPKYSGSSDSFRRHKLLAVMMLGVLLATVAVAWLVHAFPARRVRAAAEIVGDIRQRGLERYWPEEFRTDWYLLQVEGETVGWRAAVRRRLDGGGFAGVRLDVAGSRFWCEKWTLNADATGGRYAAYKGTLGAIRVERLDTEIALADAQVQVVQYINGQTLRARSPAPENYLPEGTLELMVRRVAEAAADAQFKMVFNELPNRGGFVDFGVVRIRHVGSRDAAEGEAVQLVRLSTTRGRGRLEQTFEVDPEGELRVIHDGQQRWLPATAEEVAAEFPGAPRELLRWLPKPPRPGPPRPATSPSGGFAPEAVRRGGSAPRCPVG